MAKSDEELKLLEINSVSYLIPETVWDFTLCLSKEKDVLKEILAKILDDATGDVRISNKRIWPIRAEYYRKAHKLIE